MPPQHHVLNANHDRSLQKLPAPSGNPSSTSLNKVHSRDMNDPAMPRPATVRAGGTELSAGNDSQASNTSLSPTKTTFPQLQVSSSDVSQITFGDLADGDITPLTSSSVYSSQEQVTQPKHHSSLKPHRPLLEDAGFDPRDEGAMDVVQSSETPTDRPRSRESSKTESSVDLAPGQKRTASGAIKPAEPVGPQSPGKSEVLHRRTKSIESNGSKVAEVS